MTVKALVRDVLKRLLPAPWYWRLLAWRIGHFDPELRLLRYLCDQTKVSIDIGASIGSYTVHLLNHSRKCYAFDPRPDALAHLVSLGADVRSSLAVDGSTLLPTIDVPAVLSPICTHLECVVNVEGTRIRCPCHGSTFDLEGGVLQGPATRPLRRFPARVTPDGELVIPYPEAG